MKWTVTYADDKVYKGILKWPKKMLAKYLRIIDMMETYGPDLGMPFTKAMGKGLFEIRAKGQEGIGRAFYCTIQGNEIVILHEFIKKTQKTPKADLGIAKKRLRELVT